MAMRLTKEKIKRAKELAGLGYKDAQIARQLRISTSGFHYYLKRARELVENGNNPTTENEQLMIQLDTALIEGRAKPRDDMLKVILSSGKAGNTNDAKWILHHFDSATFGDKREVKHTATLVVHKGSDVVQNALDDLLDTTNTEKEDATASISDLYE